MNAAFLLVTTACLVGQPAAQPPGGPPPAAHGAAAACGSGGCSDPCGCDGFGHRLRDRLKGLFQRDCRDNCQPTTCCNTAGHGQARQPLFHRNNSCDDCARPKLWTWQPHCRTQNTCAPATCSDPCDRGGHFLGRLRGIFQRGDRHCCGGTTTNACGSSPVNGAPIPIDAPKKMPEPIKKAPAVTPKAEVRFEPSAIPPVVTNPPAGLPSVPQAPSVEIAPIPPISGPPPRVEGDRRDPF